MLLTLDVSALSRVERLALAHMMSEHLGARVPALGTALAEAVTAAADAGADVVRVDLEWPDPDRPAEEAVRELEAAARWLHRAIRLAPQYKTLAPLNGPLLQITRTVMAELERRLQLDVAFHETVGS